MNGIGVKEIAFVGYPVTDLDRARGILERLRDTWLPDDERSDVGLFRSLEACQRALPKP